MHNMTKVHILPRDRKENRIKEIINRDAIKSKSAKYQLNQYKNYNLNPISLY